MGQELRKALQFKSSPENIAQLTLPTRAVFLIFFTPVNWHLSCHTGQHSTAIPKVLDWWFSTFLFIRTEERLE